MGEKVRTVSAYSRSHRLAKLDGRTKEAALMRETRDCLIAHCGGSPTFPQLVLIDRAAVLALRIAQIETKIVAGESLTAHDNEHALAWHNAYRRTLVAIGLKPTAPRVPTLAEHLAALAAEREETAA